MVHIVVGEKLKCPRCEKTFMGSCEEIADLIVCNECFHDHFKKELEPIMLDMVHKYFQPERLNPKNISKIPISKEVSNCLSKLKKKFDKHERNMCDSLNSAYKKKVER